MWDSSPEKEVQVIDGKTYFSFRGDNINSFDLSDRKPDPDRLLQASPPPPPLPARTREGGEERGGGGGGGDGAWPDLHSFIGEEGEGGRMDSVRAHGTHASVIILNFSQWDVCFSL